MAKEVGSNGTGVARQEFAVRTAIHTVVSLPDSLLGGEVLLARGGGTSDAEQAGDVRDFEASVTVEQEMAEQTRRVVVGALLLAKAKDSPEQSVQLRSTRRRWDVGLFK